MAGSNAPGAFLVRVQNATGGSHAVAIFFTPSDSLI